MEAVCLSNTGKYTPNYTSHISSLPDTLDEYSASGVVVWSSKCEGAGVLGLICVQGSAGCHLVYPALHLHTPVSSSLCWVQDSFGSRHLGCDECNEHRVSEIKFDSNLDTSILKTESYSALNDMQQFDVPSFKIILPEAHTLSTRRTPTNTITKRNRQLTSIFVNFETWALS
jgi:hypothetical protein